MGMIDTIFGNSENAANKKKIPPAENSGAGNFSAEISPCESCGKKILWRDSYRNWNCLECEPPRFDSQIRELRNLDEEKPADDAPQNLVVRPEVDPDPKTENRKPTTTPPGFRVMAVADPDGTIAFAPGIRQSEREAVIEDLDWWARRDARRDGTSVVETPEGIATEVA